MLILGISKLDVIGVGGDIGRLTDITINDSIVTSD